MRKTHDGYEAWGDPGKEPDTLSPEDLERWKRLVEDASALSGDMGWSKSEFARRSGVAPATFVEWFNGRYRSPYGNISDKVETFLKAPDDVGGETTAITRLQGPAKNYEPWPSPRAKPKLEGAELKRWRLLTAEVSAAAHKYKWSKAEASRKSGVASGTFSQWYDGKYSGIVSNVSDKIETWLNSVKKLAAAAAKIPEAPGFVNTETSLELIDTLLYAQLLAEMVIVTLGAGMGKTMTANHYRDTNPHSFIVTMRPSTAKAYGMMRELASALEVTERNPAKLDSAIGAVLKRNGKQTLLMIDEAQVLDDNAVNQLRYFLDVYGVGIALIGNEELYGRFGGQKAVPSYAQIHRRIGKRLKRLHPLPEDIEAIIDAWKVKDDESRKILHAIGKKPGALSQITKTMQLAGMFAAGEDRQIIALDIERAWQNRGGE